MKQAKQVELLKRMMEMIDNGTAPDAGRMVKIPTSTYVCKDLAKREWETFFRNHPQILGLSGDLPKPGRFLTNNDLGIPILATRDETGKFHAFVNACRHRGTMLTRDERGEQSRFACPFHSWTYANNGELLGILAPKMFGDVDKSCHGLLELPSVEKYGLLFIHPQLDGKLDVDSLLGQELAEEFESWDLGRAQYEAGSKLDKPLNWKLAVDVTGETYHFNTLHKSTFSELFYGDSAAFDIYGRNHSLTAASRQIDAIRKQPETQWNVSDVGIVVYYLFPNIVLAVFNHGFILFRIYPDRNEVGRSMTRISHYSAPHIGAEIANEVMPEDNRTAAENADLPPAGKFVLAERVAVIDLTVEQEDYEMGIMQQISAASGNPEYIIFGRNEPGLHHFHENYRDALGMPPLEEFRAG
jgi:phenylpropionate dioxygenase-like ring-hydroxylating dioxygenase large terminal subunit